LQAVDKFNCFWAAKMIDVSVSLPINKNEVTNVVYEAPMPGISSPDAAFAAANQGLGVMRDDRNEDDAVSAETEDEDGDDDGDDDEEKYYHRPHQHRPELQQNRLTTMPEDAEFAPQPAPTTAQTTLGMANSTPSATTELPTSAAATVVTAVEAAAPPRSKWAISGDEEDVSTPAPPPPSVSPTAAAPPPPPPPPLPPASPMPITSDLVGPVASAPSLPNIVELSETPENARSASPIYIDKAEVLNRKRQASGRSGILPDVEAETAETAAESADTATAAPAPAPASSSSSSAPPPPPPQQLQAQQQPPPLPTTPRPSSKKELVVRKEKSTKVRSGSSRRAARETLAEKQAKEGFVGAFEVKFLGSVTTSNPGGTDVVAACAKTVQASATTEPLQVTLVVSADGIEIMFPEALDKDVVFIPVRMISYSDVDRVNKNIFAFISNDATTQSMLCHLFLCNTHVSVKKKRRKKDYHDEGMTL
jgi:hypothetical protein